MLINVKNKLRNKGRTPVGIAVAATIAIGAMNFATSETIDNGTLSNMNQVDVKLWN